MTKVGQLFEEEKQEALRKLEEEQRQEIKRIKKEVKKEKKEAVEEAEKESSRMIARRMLEKGMEPSEIWSFITNLSYKEIERLKEEKER